MTQAISKRTFLGYLGALPIGLAALKFTGQGGFISSARAADVTPAAPGFFKVPPLPYAYDALEKAIDAQTMTLHHDKHHQAYVDKLNAEVEKDESLKDKTIRQIIGSVSQYNTTVRNNAGGHWNHSFFWKSMTPEATEPSEVFAEAIKKSFGSMVEFQKQFEDAGAKQFGSGWVWLIVNDKGLLEVTSTPNQDNPLMDDAKVKGAPLLGNDVWEHAYYLRYFNKRADYLKAWWSVVNWKRVSELYAQARPAA
jgi:Fe-Mn family superoxide dismutase